MVTDRFGALIEELSTALQVKLAPDSHNACRLKFKDKLEVYLQPDATGDELQIVTEIGKPGDGKYRQEIFREALRSNGLPPPRTGIFCYGQKTDTLLLYEFLPMDDLNGIHLADVIAQLSDKARVWRESISRGELPPYRSGRSGSGSRTEGFMGLH